MADRKKYVVKAQGWILGEWRNPNAHVELLEEQAAPFVFEGRLELVEPKEDSAAKSEPAVRSK